MNLSKPTGATRTLLVSLGTMTVLLLGMVAFAAAPASADDGDVLDAADCIDLGAILPLPIGCLLPSETPAPTDPPTPTDPAPTDAPVDPLPSTPAPAVPSPTEEWSTDKWPTEQPPTEPARRRAQADEPSATVTVDCDGFVANLDNTESSEATDFTLLTPTGIEEAVTVEAGDSLVMTYPVVEGRTATVEVRAGGYQLAETSFTANCLPTSGPGEPDQREEPNEPGQSGGPGESSSLLPSTGAIASGRLVALAWCLIAVGGSLVRAATRHA